PRRQRVGRVDQPPRQPEAVVRRPVGERRQTRRHVGLGFLRPVRHVIVPPLQQGGVAPRRQGPPHPDRRDALLRVRFLLTELRRLRLCLQQLRRVPRAEYPGQEVLLRLAPLALRDLQERGEWAGGDGLHLLGTQGPAVDADVGQLPVQ